MSTLSTRRSIYLSSSYYATLSSSLTMAPATTVSPRLVSSPTFTLLTPAVTPTTLSTQQASSSIVATIAVAQSQPTSSTSGLSLPQIVDKGNYDLTILILLMVLLLVGVLLIIYFVLRRVRKQQQRRIRDLEEGAVEVKEARAMRFLDDTLKGIPERPRSWQSYNSSPFFGEFDVPSGIVPHPLFHPSIKRSRSIQSPQPIHLQLPRQGQSYPRLKRYPSSSSTASFSSYLNKPMSSSTTMQIRRPETPPPPSPVNEIIMMASTTSHLRQVRSVWSFSATSTVPPSSPSVYSTTPSRTKLFKPSPLSVPRAPSPEPFSLPSPPLPSPPLSIYDAEESRPRLRSLQPPPKARIPSPPLPLPPRNPLRKSALPVGHLPPSAALDEHDCPRRGQARRPSTLLPPLAFIELPLTERSESTIERWLDGSTGTASAFGSVIGGNTTQSYAVTKPKAPRIQSLSLFPRVQSVRSSTRRLSERGPQWIGATF
ncbi:hypothetical protein N431DRAFT_477768 [Stipitochalara longipes BDJ]|nr:hypothetical protein N431DRAFT_477768 [Stipitochalara longipes BDJ]